MTTHDLRYINPERIAAEAKSHEEAERAKHRSDILREQEEAANAALEDEITRRMNAARGIKQEQEVNEDAS